MVSPMAQGHTRKVERELVRLIFMGLSLYKVVIIIVLTNYAIAKQVLDGEWGNGQERRDRLTEAGYNYEAVQSIVNALCKDPNYKPPEMLAADEEEQRKPLEIDYNPRENNGIIVNIIV